MPNLNKAFFQKIAIGAAALVLVFGTGAAVAQKIKLNPVQPAKVEAQVPISTSYEEQSIQAVRSVKPAVVDIVGNGAVTNGDVTTIDGTGFIISSDGLIVSNNHVVADPTIKYTVVFADGSQYDAKVLGLDRFNDVALLKIEANNLQVARLGNSDNLETGQTVFAIGNSLGKYQNTVTKGVVSGLSRSVDVGGDSAQEPRMQNLIQTDAAINPGNSGGPLINLNGEVIGMDTLIDTQGESLGFAVPINTIKSSVEQLQKYGKVSKPYVGIGFITVNKAVQALKSLDTGDGAYVSSVVAGGPADKAGVKVGDIIIQINREKLTQINELDQVIGKYQAGNQVLVTLMRNGKQEDLPLILGEFK